MKSSEINRPNVAVMLATYNGETYLREQLDSICNQTYENWNLYINDDNSTDNTWNILEEYQSQYPDRIVISKNETDWHGASGNFADLLNKVKASDYYVFCDQDDQWHLEKLQIMVEEIQQQEERKAGAILVYCKMQIVDFSMNQMAESFEDYVGWQLGQENQLSKLMLANYVPGCAMLFNHLMKEYIAPIPKGMKEHDWWSMVVAASMGSIYRVDTKALAYYRQHGANVIGAQKQESTIERIKNNTKMDILTSHIKNLKEHKQLAIRQIECILDRFGQELSSETTQQMLQCKKDLSRRSRLSSVFHGWKYSYCENTFYDKFVYWWFVL